MVIYSHDFDLSQGCKDEIIKAVPAEVTEFVIQSYCMYLTRSRGRYDCVLSCRVNGFKMALKIETTDAEKWDYFKSLEYDTPKYKQWYETGVLTILQTDSIKWEIADYLEIKKMNDEN